jgi:hypothetical protein
MDKEGWEERKREKMGETSMFPPNKRFISVHPKLNWTQVGTPQL